MASARNEAPDLLVSAGEVMLGAQVAENLHGDVPLFAWSVNIGSEVAAC